uniref:ATP synthase F0 subunit 8 n=1 Tax=Thraustochytrium aureum TaxID=42467 RepID=Q9G4D0_9STRA|nr:ATP synthase F0 subunit 8 [Thraustochytrium aureum]
MPQLDFITFTSQIFWLLIIFFIIYVFFNQSIVPFLARVLKIRRKKSFCNRKLTTAFFNENKVLFSEYDSALVKSSRSLNNLFVNHNSSLQSWVSINKGLFFINNNFLDTKFLSYLILIQSRFFMVSR